MAINYEYSKVVVKEVPVTPETPQRYLKKVMAKDIEGTEYVRNSQQVTREQLVIQRDVIQAEIDAIDALDA